MIDTAQVFPTLVWGAQHWVPIAAGIIVVFLALLVWGYWRAGSGRWLGLVGGTLKLIGVAILLVCLLEPLLGGNRAKPGENLFVVLTDNSQSMTLRDRDASQTRAEQVEALMGDGASWLTRLRQDFDVRLHAFDAQLHAAGAGSTTQPVDALFSGRASNLIAALEQIARRYQGRPLAGVMVLSDGVATDAAGADRLLASSPNQANKLPPIYPVLIGGERAADDLGVERVLVTQTNFEDAPVTLTAHAGGSGYAGRTIVAELQDESGKKLDEQKVTIEADGKAAAVRFQVKPQSPGVSFYRVKVAGAGGEATEANNARLVAVDRGGGPYRVLYVTGRPNWEFKFLQRALYDDDQITLIGLLRIARREPKFNFLSRAGERTNPLYRGFDPASTQEVAEYDKPVLVRAGKLEEGELKSGFPLTADELYKYHAIILDDLESEFFTQDQMQLVKEFVRQRGGGLLMLGGQETFKNGKYDRTPIGDLLPVYADEVPPVPAGVRFRLALTREGWLEPWVRLRPEEDAERKRLSIMPPFQTLNMIRGIKPGATVLARAAAEGQEAAVAALVEQRFGHGRVGALLIGDLWRWGLRRAADDQANDLEKAWRQTVRWLVADVPQRVEVSTSPGDGDDAGSGTVRLTVQVRDTNYALLDNASVAVKVTGPDSQGVELTAEPSATEPGRYEATYVARQDGAYRAQVKAKAPDGSDIGQREIGWTSEPAAEEFQTLRPNRELLERLAQDSRGQAIKPSASGDLVASLPTRHAQVTEPFIQPLWHQSWVFLLAIACLTAEWGLRRWRGLP